MPPNEEVPLHRQLPNQVVVFDPREAMKEAAGGCVVEQVQGARQIGRVAAVD